MAVTTLTWADGASHQHHHSRSGIPPRTTRTWNHHQYASAKMHIRGCLRQLCTERGLGENGSYELLPQKFRNAGLSADVNLDSSDTSLLDQRWPANAIAYNCERQELSRLLQHCIGLKHPGEESNRLPNLASTPAELNKESLQLDDTDPDDEGRGQNAVFDEGLDPRAAMDYDRLQNYLADPEFQYR